MGLVSDSLFSLRKEIQKKKKIQCNKKYCFSYYDDFHNNKIIKEKLPAFANLNFKSPLIASAAA